MQAQPRASATSGWRASAIGLISFGFLLFTQPQRAWGAWTINTLYWLGIAQGAIVLACAIRLGNGRWAGPVMRIAESFSAYLPCGIATMVVLLGAGIWTYLPWTHHVEPRQAPYLNVPFLYVRTLGGLGLLWWLSRDLVRTSLRTDAYLLRDRVDPALKNDYAKLSADWRGDEEEVRVAARQAGDAGAADRPALRDRVHGAVLGLHHVAHARSG